MSVARTSSSTDDGFVSCSSPVGNLNVNKRNAGGGTHLPIIISPHSDLTGDTINLVSHHQSTNFQSQPSSIKSSQVASLPVHSPGLNTSSCSACLDSTPYGNSSTPSTSSSNSSALRISPLPTSYCSPASPSGRNDTSTFRNNVNNLSSTSSPKKYSNLNGMESISHDNSVISVDKNSSKAPILVDCRESTV